MDLGVGRRGVDMGPSALRVAGLGARLRELGYNVEDFGDVRVKHPEQQDHGASNLKYKGPILDTCTELAVATEAKPACGASVVRSTTRSCDAVSR